MTPDFARAAQVLADATEVALACHVNPDADALGSMLGLAAFLRSRGVETVCSYPNEPLEPPRWAELLPGADRLVPAKAFPKGPAVMVTCDCAAFDRLGQLGHVANRAGEVIWIDHHRSNEGLGSIPLNDPQASSTCEMVFRLIETMGGEMPDETAVCLYAGLVTDTGKFQYENTTPNSHRMAGELLEHGVDVHAIFRRLYENVPFAKLSLLARVLNRVERYDGGRLTLSHILRTDYEETGADENYSEGLVDHMRALQGTVVAALVREQLKEGREGVMKVSLRASADAVDVSVIARKEGGGGHRQAAGFSTTRSLPDLIEFLRREIEAQR